MSEASGASGWTLNAVRSGPWTPHLPEIQARKSEALKRAGEIGLTS
ncbi:hypothetical protein [Nonomuraea insulae]|uniref:Uncharacterized protein n=1 Tax=Nonomuraea insulae TaxID=1616787 RepID=A0ABW1CVI6_9ACTN